MKKSCVSNILLFMFSAVGEVVSWLSTIDHIEFKLSGGLKHGLCSAVMEGGCVGAHQSPAAEIFGLPISLYGSAYYSAIVIFVLLDILLPESRFQELVKRIPHTIFLFAIASIFYSAYLAHILLSQNEICPFCFILYGVNIGILIVSGISARLNTKQWFSERKGLVITVLAFVAIFVLNFLIYIPTYVIGLETKKDNRDQIKTAEQHNHYQLVIPDRAPSKGSDTATSTIIEISDFECPYCAKMHQVISELVHRTGESSVSIRFINFPLDTSCNCYVKVCLHKTACDAAKAGICAQKQGRFWEYADLLFANRNEHEKDDLIKYAKLLDLDTEKFSMCLSSPETEAILKEDIEIARNAGVSATPTIFINGIKYEGFIELRDLIGLLEQTSICSCEFLRKGQQSCGGSEEHL